MKYFRGKKVFVAGGAGMVGQAVVRMLLENGARVRATQYRTRKFAISHPDLEVVSCDLADESAARPLFDGVDVAFLLAGVVAGAAGIKNRASALIMSNLRVRSTLIALAAEAEIPRVGVLSSSYVYPASSRPDKEDEGFVGDPPPPHNFGLGWVERYLETLCRHFQYSGKTRFSIARPTAIYGPNDRFDPEHSHVIPALIRRAVAREDPFEVWGTGNDVRSFTYVDDVADGLMRMVARDEDYGVLNICVRESNTVRDVVGFLQEILDFHPRVVFLSDKPSMAPYKVSDPSRAKEVLGWEARIGLREGIERTVDWYRGTIS